MLIISCPDLKNENLIRKYNLSEVSMYLFEFNNLDQEDKWQHIYGIEGDERCKFITYRKDGDQTISLWDCGSFFAEIYVLNKEILKIEGIELDSSRLDLYIDYAKTQSARTR